MRALLVRLDEVQTAVVRNMLIARGHTVAIRIGDDPAGPLRHEETYDLIVDRWPRPGRSGFTSWAVSARDAFILTLVNGQPDHSVVRSLLAAGSDDVIEDSASERHLHERILVAETAVLRRRARRKQEAITAPDIAAQLQEQEGLRDLAENLATTLNCIGDAVISCDTAAAVTWMNPAAEKLTTWNLAEAKGRPLDQIFHIVDGETRAVAESPVARVLRHGAAVAPGTHWILLRRGRTELRIADSCAPLKAPTSGCVVRCSSFVMSAPTSRPRAAPKSSA